jgi:hypothetical protein
MELFDHSAGAEVDSKEVCPNYHASDDILTITDLRPQK